MALKKLLFIFTCTLGIASEAQSYSFTASTATYMDLTGSTSLNGTATWDDPNYTIPIGFDFQYFSNTLDTFYLNDIGLGGDLLNTPNDFGVVSILQAYGADIIDRGYDFSVSEAPTGSLSNISYTLEGVTGNRILKIEWNNVGFYNDVGVNGTASTNFTNFQLWLFESDDSIEIHFGPNSITDTDLVFDGLMGSSVILVEEIDLDTNTLGSNGALLLTGSPSNPTLSTITTLINIENSVLNGVIPNGTVYRFETSGLGIDEFETSNLKLFPNPSKDFITITGLNQTEPYAIYNVTGRKVKQGDANANTALSIEALSNGLYFIEIGDGKTLKFIKS